VFILARFLKSLYRSVVPPGDPFEIARERKRKRDSDLTKNPESKE
jgi:hypothetical protein